MMKPKVLLITLNSCYPLFHGGALAQYYFLEGLKNDVEFVLCTQVNSVQEKKAIDELQRKLPDLKIYFIDHTTYNVKQERISKKLISKIKKILYPEPKELSITEPDDFKDDYFQHIDNVYEPSFIELIHSVIEKEQIKQVQFDFYNTIDLCFALPKDIKKIFVNHEVRFKRLTLAADKSDVSSIYKDFLIEKTKYFEQDCINRVDELVVFNDDDAALFRSEVKKVTVSPFAIPDELIFDLPASSEYNKLLFIGGEGHTPNLLGLTWFIDTIYQPNRERIKLPLHIIGEWSEEFRSRYVKYKEIVFLGVVDSVKEYFISSIFVNPILTGAGLRTKVLHAFCNKVPVLSTRFGAEGCFTNKENEHLGLFDDAEEFIALLKENQFDKLALQGYEYYNEFFNEEKLLKIRLSIYK